MTTAQALHAEHHRANKAGPAGSWADPGAGGIGRKQAGQGRQRLDSVDRYLNDLDRTSRLSPAREQQLALDLEAAVRDCHRIARQAGITLEDDDAAASERDRVFDGISRLWRLLDELAEAAADPERAPLVAVIEEELGRPAAALLAARAEMTAPRRRARDATTLMVSSNLALVVSMAKHYRGRGVPLADLIQEGNISLMRAASKFDPHRGVRLSTYAAAWLKQSLSRAVRSLSRTVRLPESAKNASSQSVPLDTLAARESRLSLTDVLVDDGAIPPDDAAARAQIRRRARQLLDTLSEQEALIIRRRFGIGCERAESLREVGERLCLTKERIRQIEKAALDKLRRRLRQALPAG